MQYQYGSLLTALLVISSPLKAQEWLFPFPVFVGQMAGGEVSAYSDGQSISALSKSSVMPLLQEFIKDTTIREIEQIKGDKLSTQQLEAIGITTDFNSSTLTISMSFDEKIAREYTLSLGQQYKPPVYSESGFVAWHNVFNMSADYQQYDSENTSNWLGEWLSSGNIGGVKGVNFEVSGFISGGDLIETSTYRGEAVLFVDNPDSPWRVSAGDITSADVGHLPSVPLGGLGWERLYDEVQPTRNIQNGGTQALVLSESAEIELFINDTFVSEFRLPPGRYRLDDLPLGAGNNDIRLEIRYVSGETDTIVYSQFFNTRLLREGISDFGIYAGLASSIEEDSYNYDQDQTIGSGFYEYGVNDTLTVGTNGVYHPEGYIAGIVTTFGTQFGNVGFRASTLHNDFNEEQGSIFSLDYAHQVWGSDSYGMPNFRFNVEYFDNYTSRPWSEEPSVNGYSGNVNYIISLLASTDLNLNASYEHTEELDDTWFASAELSWQRGSWSISSGVEHQEDPNEDISDTKFTFSFSWDWASDNSVYRANVSYNNSTDRFRTRFQKNTDNVVGDFGYRLTAEGDDESQQYSGLMNYVGNRFTAEGEYGYTVNQQVGNSQSASGRMSSALTLVDNNLAWGRAYSGPAAIVKVHDTLDSDVLLNALAGDEPEAISTSLISNVVGLSSGHVESEVFIDSPEAPIGYDTGLPQRLVTPGSLTGHIIYIGSEASKTVIGNLSYPNGQPAALIQGYIEHKDKRYEFFTNRSGRFVIEGIAPGAYGIWTGESLNPVGEITIPDESESLIYLPTTVVEGGNNE